MEHWTEARGAPPLGGLARSSFAAPSFAFRAFRVRFPGVEQEMLWSFCRTSRWLLEELASSSGGCCGAGVELRRSWCRVAVGLASSWRGVERELKIGSNGQGRGGPLVSWRGPWGGGCFEVSRVVFPGRHGGDPCVAHGRGHVLHMEKRWPGLVRAKFACWVSGSSFSPPPGEGGEDDPRGPPPSGGQGAIKVSPRLCQSRATPVRGAGGFVEPSP